MADFRKVSSALAIVVLMLGLSGIMMAFAAPGPTASPPTITWACVDQANNGVILDSTVFSTTVKSGNTTTMIAGFDTGIALDTANTGAPAGTAAAVANLVVANKPIDGAANKVEYNVIKPTYTAATAVANTARGQTNINLLC